MRWERSLHAASLRNPTLAPDFPARWAEQEDLTPSRVFHLLDPVFDKTQDQSQVEPISHLKLFGFDAER